MRANMQLVKRAARRHAAELLQELGPELPELRFFINTEDHPLLTPARRRPGTSWSLPVFSMCRTPRDFDVPAPDFTYMEYDNADVVVRARGLCRMLGGAGAQPSACVA